MLNENNALVRYHFDILVCIALASEVHGICKLEALENNISHNNDIVRHWAFRGLRSAYKMDIISNDFMEWCDNIIHKLEEHTGSSVSFDFDLLETVSALKYVDFGKIHDKEQGQWIRELLIFDLVERLEGSQSQRFQLYKTWLDIEDRAKEKSTRLLKLLHRFLLNMNDEILFDEFYEIIEALNKIDCDTACRILSSSDNKVLFDLRKEYLIVIIKQRLSYVNDCISDEYIQNLALDIMLQLDFSVSRKLLDALQVINNLQSFEEVFNFVVRNEITSHDIYVKNVSLPILKRTLEIKLLGNQIKDTDRLRLGTILDGLLDRNWTFEQLNEFFIKMNQSKGVDKERHFISVLEIILHYKIIPNKNSEKIIKILEKSTECWQKEINEIAVESVFSNQSQIKTSDELVQELHDSNNLEDLTKKHLLHLIESIKNPQLLSELREDPLQNRSNFDLPISQWNEDLIGQWANLIKKNHEKYCKDFDKFIIETLAVIKQASLKDTGFHLTDAQILGCLLILNSKKNQGRLLQVGTGEGKSTIISALAVFYALQGRKVDIITSSPVLAERDAKEKQKFYNMFSIGCSPNNDKAVYISGAKKCYKKEIVYGELAQFQFDTLRTEYAQLYTLGGRTCDVAIVDEVDSMLIDDGSKIARLASSVSGLDQLQIIYHLLWNQLVFIRGKIILINDKMYLFYGKIQFKEKNIVLEYESENGDLTIISDLKAYLQSTSDIRNIGVRIPDDDQGDAFIKKNLDDYIRKYIVENMKIPINFLEFIDTQIPKWIDSAITAMAYQENVHYVVHEGLIKPVDYFSTGIVQGSSNWSDGLHQFLQIKHELRMTSETFTTNFLSNKAYLTRYGLNLFGLTGTLGSEKAKEVLADAYNVDSVIIPSLRQKQHLSLPDIVVTSEQDWLRQICRSAQNESIKGRGTLIICETIEYCKLLAENLQEKYHLRAIKIYTMNNINQEKNVENVSQGEIIVATNLAGRGTDIKTEDIEKYGGLHVIITFIPPNKRVEEQAIGRTSRQGKRGTSQRILNVASLVQNKDFDVQKITQFRDGIEAQMLDEFSKNELQSINLKDELFSKFCVLINELRERIRKDAGYLSDAWHCVKNKLGYFKPSVVELNTLLSVEERWAMFLRKIDNDQSPIDSERINNEFEIFSEEIRNDHKKDCLMRNPYHHIAIGNDLILNDSSLNSKYELALKHFDKAIELDSNYCAAAFVGRGWLLVKGKEKLIVSNTQEFGYKEAAIRSFRCALEILAEEMSSLSAIQTLLQHRSSNANSLLSKQLLQKVNILGNYCTSIENTINTIRKSRRLIQIKEVIDCKSSTYNESQDGTIKRIILYDGIEKNIGKWCDIRLVPSDRIKEYIKAVEECEEILIATKGENTFEVTNRNSNCRTLDQWTINDDDELIMRLSSLSFDESILDKNKYSKLYKQVYEKVESKTGQVRADFLVPLQILPSDRECEITFNDLTVHKDTITKDQAIKVIDGAIPEGFFRSAILNRDYQNISIGIYQINSEVFKEFINPNIEIIDVTKKVALSELKDRSSFRVNLEIRGVGKEIEKQNNIQVKQAIKTIKDIPEENITYNLTFLSANNTYTKMKADVLDSTELTIEFIALDKTRALEKLNKIISQTISLEIFDRQEKVLEIFEEVEIKYVELCATGTREKNIDNITELVDKVTAEKKINKRKLNTKLIDLDKSTAAQIIQMCPNASFNIHFNKIKLENFLDSLNNESINVNFHRLRSKTAKILIEQLRKRNFDFNLSFKKLTSLQAQYLIEMAPIKQENIEINNVKSLRELFMNDARPDLELAEYSARGIEYILQTSEKGFIPWLSIGILTCIATLQIGLGALFITTAFGASLGMNVITEGVADIFYAYRTSRSRQFSWIDYGKQKAVSLIISAVTLGFSSFKDAAKGAQTLVQGAEREALEQAGTRLIMNGKSSGATLIKTGKNFQSLAVKYISVSFGEAAVKEGLNAVADIGSNFALEQLKPQISASIQDKITNKFCQPDLLKILRKMFAIDLINKQQKLKDKINKIVGDIINPRHSFWRRQWESVGGPLCKGILSSAEKIRSPASMAIRIIGILNGMHEIISLIDNIYNQLLEELRQIDHDYLSMHRILHDYCEIAEQNTTGIVTIFSKNGIQEINDALADKCFQSKLKNISFNEFETVKPRVVEFLTSLNKKMLDLQIDDFSEIMKSVSDVVTEQILRISQSQLISPFSTFVVSELTNAISERIQHHFIVDQNQNSDSQNQEINENKNYGYNTISKQIQGNAKDYTIAYSQCEIIYHALQSKLSGNHRGKLNNETEEYVKGVRNDKPASLADMMGLAASYGLDIKIVDDENYIPTEDDKEKGTHIIVFSPGERDGQGNIDIGHYRLMQDDDTDNHNRREKNDCGYVVIQKILSEQGVGKTIEDLRNDCAQSIKDSPQLFLTAHQAQTWVEARYPVNANSLLFIGGTASNQRPRFELNPNNPWVGIYGELDDPWYGRKCQYELNHIPPLDALKGTDFKILH
ncbi:unnamed protein product [Rotaria sp. Silwood1]|nr:unnamed protein product [Rotaria sp. Silwood1]